MSGCKRIIPLVLAIGVASWVFASSASSAMAVGAEHAAAEAESGAVGHSEPNPLALDPDLAIWTVFVFVILLAVLWKFAWGPISAALEKREETIAEHIAEAQRSHKEAKELLAQYERKLAHASEEVRDLLAEARRDAEHTKQEIIIEAKSAADAERTRALNDIEAATDQALKSLAERSAALAVELAGKIVKSKLTSAEHARLIQEAVAKFPQGAPGEN